MRLFIAVNLPDDVRRTVWDAAASLRRADYPVKWVDVDSIHVTVKFLGDVPDRKESEIVDGLRRAVEGTRPFTLHIAGFGAFPAPERARVVWVGCEPVPPLELVQHRTEQEMERIGFPLEGRPFHPHLTLGRAKRDARPSDFRDFAAALDALSVAGKVPVSTVDLMQSTLTPHGARYTRRHAVPLGSPAV